jgi:hypothetical protein
LAPYGYLSYLKPRFNYLVDQLVFAHKVLFILVYLIILFI